MYNINHHILTYNPDTYNDNRYDLPRSRHWTESPATLPSAHAACSRTSVVVVVIVEEVLVVVEEW